MFVCNDCHVKTYGTRAVDVHFSGSYGPCEVCGHTRSCADCRCYRADDVPSFEEPPGQRYFLREGETPWREVTKAEWVRAERAAGFHNTMGRPDEPGTAGFSDGRLSGKIAPPLADPS